MIKNWTVTNFKSVYDKTTLDIGPLTIFTGANSSGKSTIVQSILLATQTLQNNVHSRSLILNGHILRLGTFEDILSDSQESKDIAIGFELDLSENIPYIQRYYRYRNIFENKIEKPIVKCEFSFSSLNNGENNELASLHPKIQTCEVIFKNKDNLENHEEIKINRVSTSIEERKRDLEIVNSITDFENSLEYKVEIDDKITESIYRFPKNGKVVGLKLMHFLPDKLAVVYDENEEIAKEIVESISEYRPRPSVAEYRPTHHTEKFNFELLTKEILNIISEKLNDYLEKGDSQEKIIRDRNKSVLLNRYNMLMKDDLNITNISKFLRNLPTIYRKVFTNEIKQQEEKLIKIFKKNIEPKYVLDYVPLPWLLDNAVNNIREYFSQNVKYLGPLRDEPKPIYPHSGATDSKDVGYKGEHTAAVLEVHKNTEINYIPPIDLFNNNIKPRKDTLINAVLDWLGYLGVVSQVETIDRGKLGHELKVKIEESNSFHDLTNVGVGVSQVLPILVLSLLAEQGSTLIFEQPELHLHPRVQTRLADFFVSIIKMKKQCIVESHSEYLINRLRYMSAVSESNEVSKDVTLYFVEKITGKSNYRQVKINKYGVIEEWPKGFFDENEENSAAILRAAMKKKRKEQETND